ncbi:hypothetical protein PAXINDRAFT_7793 [Paxillus involutus ATCC 200175]|nr:hypothetical protein PAXINDRAFT_7793 [Paxillus involutus ATCC 200175]
MSALDDMGEAPTKTAHKRISKLHGLCGEPTLCRVNSLDYSICAPWEWMHLFLENVVPTLVKLWTGQFKGMDEGRGNYEIAPQVWELIGDEMAASVASIPSTFMRVLPNIANGLSNLTAESWGFWFMHIAPIVLQG